MRNPIRIFKKTKRVPTWDELVGDLQQLLLEIVKVRAMEEYFASRPCEFCGNTEPPWTYAARLWDHEIMVEVQRDCGRCGGHMAVSLPSEFCHG